MSVQLLDCTLRDGGYLVEKFFHENTIHNIVTGLTQAGIDYVELGFLQDVIEKNETVCFLNSVDARKYIPINRKNTLYTAFADFSRYSVSNLDDFDGQSFDCVRACFFKEERMDAFEFCREIKRKGYKVFAQPVGILRYSMAELLDLIAGFNEIEPYCFSIVDTFGSMYFEDLRLKLAVIHSELLPDIKLGFHSHNNKELSNALSMEFVNIMKSERNICVDATLYGIGRGAGNTRTEIIVDYLNKRLGKNYDLPMILDIIDISVQEIASRKKWGYDLQMYLAGIFGSHINNVNYLSRKVSLRTKDIAWILNRLTDDERSRYDYSRLDELYIECLKRINDVDDGVTKLHSVVHNKMVLVVAPGNTVNLFIADICEYISAKNPIVISVNFVPQSFNSNFTYFNNPRRYDYFENSGRLIGQNKILTSNVKTYDDNSIIIPIEKIVKNNTDNSTILLLYLLDMLGVKEIAIAGFDGLSDQGNNYASGDLERKRGSSDKENSEIKALFQEFIKNKTVSRVRFITPSKYIDKEK
ncbi:MAG: hypothetical protein LBS21_00795 [Clostridiales bacterium]|jgi:4-hydroxy 2-oxovalerate aldolase|nr:hypothetical protein [Clostridiales bacterium]